MSYFHILAFVKDAQAEKAHEILKEKIDPQYTHYTDPDELKHEACVAFTTDKPLSVEQMEIVNSLGSDPDYMDLNNEEDD